LLKELANTNWGRGGLNWGLNHSAEIDEFGSLWLWTSPNLIMP